MLRVISHFAGKENHTYSACAAFSCTRVNHVLLYPWRCPGACVRICIRAMYRIYWTDSFLCFHECRYIFTYVYTHAYTYLLREHTRTHAQMDRLPAVDGFVCFHELVKTSQLFGSDLSVTSNYAVVMFCEKVEKMPVSQCVCLGQCVYLTLGNKYVCMFICVHTYRFTQRHNRKISMCCGRASRIHIMNCYSGYESEISYMYTHLHKRSAMHTYTHTHIHTYVRYVDERILCDGWMNKSQHIHA